MLTPPAAAHALLFASGEPIEKKRLAELLDIKEKDLPVVLQALVGLLKGSGLALIETSKEVELRTSPEASVIVKKFREGELSRDLGKASLETLAVIAYHAGGTDGGNKGATRSEVDWVRGVNSSTSIRTLLMRSLIEGKEDESDKRRVRYNITTEALAHLGLTRIEDLPRYKELATGTRDIVKEEMVQSVSPQAT